MKVPESQEDNISKVNNEQKEEYTSIIVDVAYLNEAAHGMRNMLRSNGHPVDEADMSAMLDWIGGILGLPEQTRESNEVLVHLIYDKKNRPVLDAFVMSDLDADYKNKAFHGYYGEFSFLLEPFEMLRQANHEVFRVISDTAANIKELANIVFIGDEESASLMQESFDAHSAGKRFVHYSMNFMEMTATQIPLGLALLASFGVSMERIQEQR